MRAHTHTHGTPWQVNYYARHILAPLAADPEVERRMLRSLYGLPHKAVVFANFNKADKIEPTIWGVWMAALRRAPHSVLWLLEPHSNVAGNVTVGNLKLEAAAHGVHPSRLIFAPRADKAEHIRRHRAADLFLDTFFYGAHSTATDSLRGGLPVITLSGDAFPRRVGVSLLRALPRGVEEALHVESFKAMEAQAVAVTGVQRGVLECVTRVLRGEGVGARLFDTKGYTSDFESALEAVWEARGASGNTVRYHVVRA